MKTLLKPESLVTLETAISNRDKKNCLELYNKYLNTYQLEKDNYPLSSFLFDSLESKQIKITQNTIDEIQFIIGL